jgi:hypothetical protein
MYTVHTWYRHVCTRLCQVVGPAAVTVLLRPDDGPGAASLRRLRLRHGGPQQAASHGISGDADSPAEGSLAVLCRGAHGNGWVTGTVLVVWTGGRAAFVQVQVLVERPGAQRRLGAKKMNNSHCPALRRCRSGEAAPSLGCRHRAKLHCGYIGREKSLYYIWILAMTLISTFCT